MTAPVQTVDRGPRAIARKVTIDAPVAQVFALVADPHRHHEIDGSGTVQDEITGPDRLSPGAKFTAHMKYGVVPYKITSTTTAFADNELVEWQHPLGHRWRWEFRAIDDTHTEVTEVWDYHENKRAKMLELIKYPKKNAAGIESTLSGLAARFA
jgi:uncharacterized protein YndB with AHSA1/START domain